MVCALKTLVNIEKLKLKPSNDEELEDWVKKIFKGE